MSKTLCGAAVFLLLALHAPAAQRYAARGLILKVDKPHSSLLVSCEAIPNVMDAMVMPFAVRNSQEIEGLTAGTMIEFTLLVDGQDSYIESIHVRQYQGAEQDPLAAQRLKLMSAMVNPASAPRQIQVGEHVPNFKLIDQARHDVTLAQFSGKTVVLAFTYTHCVLPNFCFRNSNNFRLLAKRFEERMGRDLVLITVTFDPEHDTPEVLARYAKTWSAEPGRWEVLTGDTAQVSALAGSFGLSYWFDEGLMNHSLRTAIIDGKGNLAANLEGNEYTADELGDLVAFIMDQPRSKRQFASGQ
jgi:protein SCO1